MGALAPEVEAAGQEDGVAVAGGDVVTMEVVQVPLSAVSGSNLCAVVAIPMYESRLHVVSSPDRKNGLGTRLDYMYSAIDTVVSLI